MSTKGMTLKMAHRSIHGIADTRFVMAASYSLIEKLRMCQTPIEKYTLLLVEENSSLNKIESTLKDGHVTEVDRQKLMTQAAKSRMNVRRLRRYLRRSL